MRTGGEEVGNYFPSPFGNFVSHSGVSHFVGSSIFNGL